MEIVFVLALVAAVGGPLAVYIPGSRRRVAQVVELKDFTDCLVDRAMTDEARLIVVDFLTAIVNRDDVKARLEAIALEAKGRLRADHALVGLLHAETEQWVAGWAPGGILADSIPQRDSYCRLTLAGRPVVIDDSLANLMVKDSWLTEHIRAYLGVPLVVREKVVGTLCAWDDEPRDWTEDDEQALIVLGGEVERELEARVAGGI